MGLVHRALEVAESEGIYNMLIKVSKYTYSNFLRSRIPQPRRGYIIHNGVKVDYSKLLDPVFHHQQFEPDREGGIVNCHVELTNSGDNVTIVGGGDGITAVRAAKQIGESGSVIIYEGGDLAIREIQWTIQENGVSDNCEVVQAVVGSEINVYGGETSNSDFVSATELPECDVLELDCEGSEYQILEKMVVQPRVLIIEFHPWNYSEDPTRIFELLADSGYEIQARYGHDGTPLSDDEFHQLYKNSYNQKKEKRLEGGGRWPVVAGFTREMVD